MTRIRSAARIQSRRPVLQATGCGPVSSERGLLLFTRIFTRIFTRTFTIIRGGVARGVTPCLVAALLLAFLSVSSFASAKEFVSDDAPAPAAAPLRIAVAPFAGDARSPSIASRVTEALSLYSHERLLAPGSFVAEPGLAPSSAAVRGWAYNAAVDDLLLGRVLAGDEFESERLELVVRSGHSGAERLRVTRTLPVVVARDGNKDDGGVLAATLASVVEELLVGLGYTDPDLVAGVGVDSGVDVAAGSSSESADDETNTGRGLDAKFGNSGFNSDAPIEIKADEAEIINRESGRELRFQRNVLVRQANVTLRSDELEATYKRGASEPERLIAQGRVFVDQGERQAKCDRAVYLRAEQQLTCRGHAELVQGCDIVRGESIQFDLAADRARVEGAASIVIRPESDGSEKCADGGELL